MYFNGTTADVRVIVGGGAGARRNRIILCVSDTASYSRLRPSIYLQRDGARRLALSNIKCLRCSFRIRYPAFPTTTAPFLGISVLLYSPLPRLKIVY